MKSTSSDRRQGTVTYSKVSGNKKITIDGQTGRIKLKKKLRKGVYKVKVKINAEGNASYKAGTRTVTFKVKVQ